MKLLQYDIPLNVIFHNDLECYVKSKYGGKDIKIWPFYNFIKIWIEGNREQARNLWINWLVEEFTKYCLDIKSKGGMYQGSVHQYAVEHVSENKDEKWLNPILISKINIKEGATFLVDKRIQMINSILNKGYQINTDDPIIAVKIKDRYVLKGGHHRATVLYILGYEKLPGVIVYSKPLWEFRKWVVKLKKFIK